MWEHKSKSQSFRVARRSAWFLPGSSVYQKLYNFIFHLQEWRTLCADFAHTNMSTRPSTNRTVSVSISSPIQPFVWTRSSGLNTWGQANNRPSHVNSIFTLNLKPWFYYGENLSTRLCWALKIARIYITLLLSTEELKRRTLHNFSTEWKGITSHVSNQKMLHGFCLLYCSKWVTFLFHHTTFKRQ